MKVAINNHLYEMSRKEYIDLLEIAKQQVRYGIYAVERNGYAELRCDNCESSTHLKALIRQYKQNGFKVYANKRQSL